MAAKRPGCAGRARPALAAALALALAAPAAAASLRIAVAGNFRATLERLLPLHQDQTGHRALLSSASSGALYAQIIQGAPHDVFLSADSERPRRLERDGRIVPGSRATYARGRLALLFAPGVAIPAGEPLADTARWRHIAIANPATAPYGRAALETLSALGARASLNGRLVRASNVAQAQQWVDGGHAEIGLVALSGVLAAAQRGGRALRWRSLPEATHTPLVQQLVLLQDSPRARAFAAFIRSAPARALMRRHGYR